MSSSRYLALMTAATVGFALVASAQEPIVFRSDVNMLRVDAQVVDRDNRAITGLQAADFLLRESGKPLEIRKLVSEDMPIDLLLLLDVSGSMRPHVQRLASAANQALAAFGQDDRVGIMVFDRATRLRMPFRSDRRAVERELDNLLRMEMFNGGTDVVRGLLDAARYVGREGRRDARRAIVILTDDQTEFNRDDGSVSLALTRADAVLSALIAPDAAGMRGGRRAPPPTGGSWPGSGGGPWGGVIIGGGGRPRGGAYPPYGAARTTSAGTPEIARASGGDSMPVDDAYALETTLARLRQRYSLYFYLPEGVSPGQERVEVLLANNAGARYPGSEVRYRRVNLGTSGSSTTEPISVSRAPSTGATAPVWRSTDRTETIRRRPRGDVSTGPRNGPLDMGRDDSSSTPEPKAAPRPAEDSTAQPSQDSNQGGGWRQLKPGEKP